MGWVQDPDVDLPGHWVSPHYPGWLAWRGVAGLFYARRPRSSPPKVVRGRSLAEVAVGICQADPGMRSGPPPADWPPARPGWHRRLPARSEDGE